MPTFDFQCAKCSNVFEFTRSFGSKTVPTCPLCKSKKTKKLIAPPAVHFKGGGWYKTDSRGPEPKAAEPEKKKEAPKTEAKPSEKKMKSAPPSTT